MVLILYIFDGLLLMTCSCWCASSSGESLTAKDLALSKSLSWLLRHGAITEGLTVNENGYILLEQVLQHRLFARRCTAADIRRVVTLSKNRFSLQANPKTGIYEIRANSGHTFKDSNNQEVKAVVKLNRGRPIPQPGLRTVKNNQLQAENLRNYNLPVGNIRLSEEEDTDGRYDNDKLMKYTELKKALLWILRHGAGKEGLTVKRHGYVPVNEILTHSYFKNKCMREDIITVANNEPHNFKIREGSQSQKLYIRARKEHPIKQEQEDWSMIQRPIYLPLEYIVHGINGSDWDYVSQNGLKVSPSGYLHFSPYEPADCWHTRGVTQYDDIYIYINVHDAMQDGIEFFRTPEDSVATKGDSKGFIGTQYFRKVVEAQTGVTKITSEDLKVLFRKYGEVSRVFKEKNKAFAFVQFIEESSVEKVLKARIYYKKSLLFVHKYQEQNPLGSLDEKSRKLSDVSSNASQPELEPGKVGLVALPVELPDQNQCPDPQKFFEWQVNQFVSQVELPAERCHSLIQVVSDVEEVFQNVLPGCRVLIFGSCSSSLAFRDSDVDLFVQCVGHQPKEFVKKEARAIYRSRLLRIITRIPSARVPIIKLEHINTGWLCDLTAHSKLGVYNSRLIRFLISLDPRIRPLLMVVKYWAKVCGVTGSTTNLTTYSLVMLVIFYLQQRSPPILPPVATLQRLADHKELSNGWNCSFCDDQCKLKEEWPTEVNKQTLRELLIGFFLFYSSFDFNNVLCPLLGQSIPVSDFDDPDKLPKEMQLYLDNKKSDPKLEFRRNVMLRMQDPFELDLNITRNVADKNFLIFQKACLMSYDLGTNRDDNSLLETLFSISKESLDVRGECCKIHIPYENNLNDSNSSDESISESKLSPWYDQNIEAIMLVFRELLKINMEPNTDEVLSKVTKFESSQDVHTPQKNFRSENDFKYICSVLSPVWLSRSKTSKLLNQLNIHLNDFEKEICISNILYKPDESFLFYFDMMISSFDKFMSTAEGIDIVINDKRSLGKGQMKELTQYIKHCLKFHIRQAMAFLKITRQLSLVNDVKEPLKRLHVKLSKVPNWSVDLSTISDNLEDIEDPNLKEKDDKVLQQQNSFLQICSKEGQINKKENGTEIISQHFSEGVCILSNDDEEQTSKILETPCDFVNNVEIEESRINKITSGNVVYDKTQTVAEGFLKTDNPDEMNIENCNILTNLKTHETESLYTSDKRNPFLEAIEKVSKQPMFTQDNFGVRNEPNETMTGGVLMTNNSEEIHIASSNECISAGDKRNSLLEDLKKVNKQPMFTQDNFGFSNEPNQTMAGGDFKTNNSDVMRIASSNECINTTDNLSCNKLTNFKNHETESLYTSDKRDSFLEALEKVNKQPMFTQDNFDFSNEPNKITKQIAVEKTSNNELDISVKYQESKATNSCILDKSLIKCIKKKDEKSEVKPIIPKGNLKRSGDYQFHDESVDRAHNHNEFNRSFEYQCKLSKAEKQQRMWYPTLFKHK